MTVTVNFESPQVRPENGQNGIEISQVVIPYSIHNMEDVSQYLGGQTVLTKEDGIALSDNTSDLYKKALVKIKDMVATSEFYTPDVAPLIHTSDVTQDVYTPNVTPEQQNTDDTKGE